MRTTLLFSSLLLFASCSPEPSPSAAPIPTETSAVRIECSKLDQAEGMPAGWIYAFDRASGKPDACVYVWSADEWSIGHEVVPGHYGTEVARGAIDDGVAIGFPAEVLRDARTLYVAGHIEAELDKQSIGRDPK